MFYRQAAAMLSGKKGGQGFTLLEVLIAIAIFSIGILAVGTMQINSVNSNTGARIHTEASTWLVDRIERMAAMSYDDPALAAGTHSVDQGIYTISWTVVDDSPVAGAKRIAVTATGTHPRARPLTIDFIKAR
ncbi:MAG: prepilin-type N-terminal cleavage/methylation domain-containing protein [Desulfobacterales bacterium]|jgi:prepilin-type N-terminal cleavage/methylation domain-containing protein